MPGSGPLLIKVKTRPVLLSVRICSAAVRQTLSRRPDTLSRRPDTLSRRPRRRSAQHC